MENITSEDSLNLNEITILGNILTDTSGNNMLTAAQLLKAEDFSDERNEIVYQGMLEINSKGQKPDMASLVDTLTNMKKIDDIGGIEYLNSILENTSSFASIETYISRLKDNALLKKFLTKLKSVYDQATVNPIKDVSEFIGKAETEINEIAKQRSIKEAKRLEEISPSLVSQWVEQTKEIKESGNRADGVTGVRTGYEALDKLTKGWHKGNMIIIGARPSVGKTAFALNLLYKVASQNIPVIFFSLEMSDVAIEMRLLELASGLNSTQINSMMFEPDSTSSRLKIKPKNNDEASNVDLLQQGLKELGRLPFYVDENPGTNMLDISAKCRKLINGQNIKAGVIAIDYIGLINSSSKSNNDSRQNQVAEISRQLKQLARELKIPIIVLSQLSRDSDKRTVTNHKPRLTDLRDSGALEQDADMVFFLYREDYFDSDKGEENKQKYNSISSVDLNLAKNRDGQLGTVKFVFDKEHCKFDALETDYQE